MRINFIQRRRSEQGSVVAYFIFLLVVVTAIASVCAFVTQTVNVTHRHNEMVEALALAEGGATLAAAELEAAVTSTNQSGSLLVNLLALGYSMNSALGSQSNFYQRIITTPFSEGSVTVQIWTNDPAPKSARIVGRATVGKVTQSASLQVRVGSWYEAAIVSDNPGKGGGIARQAALRGNVALMANAHPTFVLDGGNGYAVLANGSEQHNANLILTLGSMISDNNASKANEIPDYTAEGSSDQLFDFQRFIAVADLTPSGPSPDNNNHFTNMNDFRASLITNSAANPYEGVLVVDVHKYTSVTTTNSKGKVVVQQVPTGDFADLTQLVAPNGINVRGTLVFNFAADVLSTDELTNTTTLNINAANLAGVTNNPSDPANYTSSYPATYSNPAKNPVNIDITNYKGLQLQNFAVDDDLPALMNNIGILNIQGNANVCGVVYTPSRINIEEIGPNQIQYFRGTLIAGGGVYVENKEYSVTIISYDANALDQLATSRNRGKRLKLMYWQ